MATKKTYIGSFGPYPFEDDELINDADGDFSGIYRHAITTDRQLFVDDAPTLDEHVARWSDVQGKILDPVAVTDIDDPSTELNALAGKAGVLLLVYEVGANADESTLYAWDNAVGTGEDVPYIVDGSSGFWIAVAGKYSNATIEAKDVIIPGGVGSPTYDDMQDWLRMTRSAGRLTDGAGILSAYEDGETPDGKVSIAEHDGMIFTTNELGGTYIYFKQAAAVLDLTGLADNKVYWIYFDWNSGTPQYAATSTRTNIHEYDQFTIGRVWRSGTTVEVQQSGHILFDKDRRSHNRLILKYGNMDRVSGAVISAHATALRLACTAGTWYVANYPFTTDSANTFYVLYKSGSATWLKSSELTLFSAIFDGAAAKTYETYQNGDNLASLTANKYGVYWIFICPEGDLYVVLGDSTYANIGVAQDASVPTSLPPYVVDWGRLIGRVIIKNSAAAFYSVESVFTTQFTLSATVDHDSLGGLNTGDYQHLLAVEYTELSEWLDDVTLGSNGLTSVPEIVLVPRAAALNDVQGGMYYSSGDDSVYVCTSAV